MKAAFQVDAGRSAVAGMSSQTAFVNVFARSTEVVLFIALEAPVALAVIPAGHVDAVGVFVTLVNVFRAFIYVNFTAASLVTATAIANVGGSAFSTI